MKKTIANSNQFFSTAKKRETMIVNAVYTSVKAEGSKTTKQELRRYFKLLNS